MYSTFFLYYSLDVLYSPVPEYLVYTSLIGRFAKYAFARFSRQQLVRTHNRMESKSLCFCESVFQIYISAKRSEKKATCTFLTCTCQHFQRHEATPTVHIFSPHRRKEAAKFSKGKKISSGQLTYLGYWWCYCWRNPLAMSRQRLETSWRSSSTGT